MWGKFGLNKNPYDILPLVEGEEYPITEAFVGRAKERKYMNTLFESEERLCLTVCGNVGVGKTSVTNYVKYILKYNTPQKPLFSFRREIEANENLLNKKMFLLEVMGSILREIALIDAKLLTNNNFLSKLNQMVDIVQTFGISGSVSASLLGLTAQSNFNEKQLIQPYHFTNAALEQHFMDLLAFIRSHKIGGIQYKGIIVHVNNFEYMLKKDKKKVIQFFSEMRDFFQNSHMYFIFLGPSSFFKDIVMTDKRVRSVFHQTPIMLQPLSKKELIEALNKRLEFFRSKTANTIIKPFDDDVIKELYDVFDGDVRMVMAALTDIVAYSADKIPKTLGVNEALLLLGEERLSHITSLLTPTQMQILAYIVSNPKPVTQNEIARALNKAPTNISNYYFRPLIDSNVIEIKKTLGKNKYWGLTEKYLPLKNALQAQEAMHKQLADSNKIEIEDTL